MKFSSKLCKLIIHIDVKYGGKKEYKKCLNVRQKLGTRNFAKLSKLAHSHSFTLDMLLLFSSLCSKVTLTLSHSHALTLTHSLSLSHSLNLSFNHSWHAEQVLFSCLCSKVTVYWWKWQCDIWVHWAGSPKPTLSIYSSSLNCHGRRLIRRLLSGPWEIWRHSFTVWWTDVNVMLYEPHKAESTVVYLPSINSRHFPGI